MSRGFTLVEFMVVVSVIAILAAAALPTYNAYRIRAAESACLAEMKNYAALSLVAIANDLVVHDAPQKACFSADKAVGKLGAITAQPQTPGKRGVTCTMENSTCKLDD